MGKTHKRERGGKNAQKGEEYEKHTKGRWVGKTHKRGVLKYTQKFCRKNAQKEGGGEKHTQKRGWEQHTKGGVGKTQRGGETHKREWGKHTKEGSGKTHKRGEWEKNKRGV